MFVLKPLGVLLAIALFASLVACGSSGAPPVSLAEDTFAVPQAVIVSANTISEAASGGDPERVGALAAPGFEFDFERPDVTLAEHLGLDDGEILRRLVLVLDSAPGRRQSPFGNGEVQELWVYPSLALELVSDWTEEDIHEALSSGLFSSDELAEFQIADAYLGHSVGLTPEGDWVFFTEGRVGRTPR